VAFIWKQNIIVGKVILCTNNSKYFGTYGAI